MLSKTGFSFSSSSGIFLRAASLCLWFGGLIKGPEIVPFWWAVRALQVRVNTLDYPVFEWIGVLWIHPAFKAIISGLTSPVYLPFRKLRCVPSLYLQGWICLPVPESSRFIQHWRTEQEVRSVSETKCPETLGVETSLNLTKADENSRAWNTNTTFEWRALQQTAMFHGIGSLGTPDAYQIPSSAVGKGSGLHLGWIWETAESK